jgi:hypothetical protein
MSGLRLIASYPRSGNTWVRAFLTALVRGGPPDINALDVRVGAERQFFDDTLEIETSDLLHDEQRRLRPGAFRSALQVAAEGGPLKTHDAWLTAPGAAEPPFPREHIEAVVLIVRDPRDVAPSLATYFGVTTDSAIELMANPEWSLGGGSRGLMHLLPQLVSSWSQHTASWLASDLPVLLVRYEDMIAKPLDAFPRIAEALKYDLPRDSLARLLDATQFDRLKAEEARKGFRESSRHAPNRFFGSGTAGGWRQKLTAAQADRIVREHGSIMRELGYGD